MRRIGIYGGSFNPPHLGHVLAARNARALLQLGEILFIPAAIPPHKAVAGGSPDGETRLALTELAIAGEPGMSVSRIELDRPGPSYTVDTLRALRESYGQDELFLLMGTDMFLSFFQWREPEAIAKLATPVCMARVRADAALSAALQQQSQAVETAFGVRPIVLQNECLEISSTEARRLLFFGIADGLLHPDVLAKIEREKLYGVGSEYFAAVKDEYRRRRDTAYEMLMQIPGVVCRKPEGAFYLMAKLPVDSTDAFQIWMLEHFSASGDTVMITPGEGFYTTPGKGVNEIRIAYVLKQADLERAMDLLALGIQAYKNR